MERSVTFLVQKPSGRLLMQLRDEHSKRYPKKWCFPGGAVEPGEDELSAVLREIEEEYEITVAGKHCTRLGVHELSYGSRAAIYLCAVPEDTRVVMHEGAAMEWMTLDKIKTLSLGYEHAAVVKMMNARV